MTHSWRAESSSRPAVGQGIILRLLIGSQNRIESGIGLGVDCGELSLQSSDGCGYLIDGGCVVCLNGGGERVSIGLQARLHALTGSECVRKDCGRLRLLGGRQAKKSGKLIHSMLDHCRRIGRWSRRAAAIPRPKLGKSESGRKRRCYA